MGHILGKFKGKFLASFAFGGVALAAFLFVSSGTWRAGATVASPASELLSEIPPGAPTLVYIDLDTIRKSSFYQLRPDHAPLTIPDKDYARFIQATGFDFEKDLDQVVLASWPKTSPTAEQKTVVVVEGRFDRRKILDYAMKNGRVVHEQGREVFQFPSQKNNGWESLTFLGTHRIALVQGMSIAQLTVHPAEAKAAANDPVRTQAARLDGVAAFAISRAPLVPENLASEDTRFPQLAGLAHSLRMVTLSGRPEGDDFRVSLEGRCRTQTDARQIQSTLNVLRMMVEASIENPKARQQMGPVTFGVVSHLLKSVEITAAASHIGIQFELTPQIFKLRELQKPR